MNNSFLSLPDDRRTSVINAALSVFPVWVQEKSHERDSGRSGDKQISFVLLFQEQEGALPVSDETVLT